MKLFARPGWGSALVEYQLDWYAMPFERVVVEDLFQSATARAALQPLNPLAQIPTLHLADGTVLTESAAITLWLADLAGNDSLVPAANDAARAAFLRWLIFLVANIYPCFTFADDPARFVEVDEARKPFRAAVNAHAERLWRQMESAAGAPWFLGDRFSAIDIYLAVMTRWRPGWPWFQANTPRLAASAQAAREQPRLAAAVARNHDPLLD